MILIENFGSFIIFKCLISWNDVNGIKILLFNYATKLQMQSLLRWNAIGFGIAIVDIGDWNALSNFGDLDMLKWIITI